MNFYLKAIVTIGCMFCATGVFAQKIGHVNASELLTSLESWKAALSQYDTHAKMVNDRLEQQKKTLVDEFQKVKDQEAQGLLTPKQLEEKQKYFDDRQNQLAQDAEKADKELAQKELELTKPIRDRVTVAINAVVKEGGYTYIIDTSSGILLYADPALDLTAAVKAKL